MTAQLAQNLSRFRAPKETIGDLDAETAARVMAASSDVAMVIDRDGVIRDIAISNSDMPMDGFTDLVERRWVDTVASESKHKVEEILRDALGKRDSRWREINQQSPRGTVPFRYVAMEAGHDGSVIALGRDLRGVAAIQQRLLQAQQSMERDYLRLRQAESRYRLLFQISSEAVLIVDPATKKIVDANPAAGALLGVGYESLSGQQFTKFFHAEARDAALVLLADLGATRNEPVRVRLADGRSDFQATASMFRQDGGVNALIRLSSTKEDRAPSDGDAKLKLLRVLNRIPDAFVITDEAFNIIDVNLSFLELSQLPSAEAAKGKPLEDFIGRAGVDLSVLVSNLREHGSVRNFGTVLRTAYGDSDEVEISAVSVREGLEAFHGFVIRAAKRVPSAPSTQVRELPRTGEQLTELVGRVSLREIVRETTDVIERMCIEAALALTNNNRASAAEVLGLSRQSLYAKLNRYGLGSSDAEPSPQS
jgi:transcriptional regulator PpsR